MLERLWPALHSTGESVTAGPAMRWYPRRPGAHSPALLLYATKGGDAPDGRRPKATLHWISGAHAVSAEARLYSHLFTTPEPGADGDRRSLSEQRYEIGRIVDAVAHQLRS